MSVSMARMRRLRTHLTHSSGGQNPDQGRGRDGAQVLGRHEGDPAGHGSDMPIMSDKTASGEIDRPDSARSW